ncbi:MAG: VOC family protein [Chlorobi bacterium]|nr:VOC family protein [Chlorobiota bacterium]
MQCKPNLKKKLPLIDKQIVFMYYHNLDSAAFFYENTLGFENTYDDGWVKIYKTTDNSLIGLVDILKTGFHKEAEKQVMLSFEASNIKGWYAYLKSQNVSFIKELSDENNTPISAFLIKDPGGYKVEFFKWKH